MQKRLDFIGAELERLDSQLKAHKDRQARREQQVQYTTPQNLSNAQMILMHQTAACLLP